MLYGLFEMLRLVIGFLVGLYLLTFVTFMVSKSWAYGRLYGQAQFMKDSEKESKKNVGA